MVVKLKVLTDIYSKPDSQGRMKVVKRNVEYHKQFETQGLLVEHYLTSKGAISKKWCVVKVGDEFFRLAHKFEEIERLTRPIKIEGFIKYNK
jgi:hypothetical protein